MDGWNGGYPMQMRKVIFDGARIGVGVLKGPFPDVRTRKSYWQRDGVGKLQIVQKIAPACKVDRPVELLPLRPTAAKTSGGRLLLSVTSCRHRV